MTATERAAEEAERRVRENDGLTYDMEVDAFVAGAEWHAEQSSTLAVEKVIQVLNPGDGGSAWDGRVLHEAQALAIARAIVTKFGPLVSTRERIIETTARTLHPSDFRDAESEYPTRSREDYEAGIMVARIDGALVADALLASGAVVEPGTLVVDREALARVLHPGEFWDDTIEDYSWTKGEALAQADGIIASDIMRDAREVRAEQIERDARIAKQAGTAEANAVQRSWAGGPEPLDAMAYQQGIVRAAKAAATAIREQKP